MSMNRRPFPLNLPPQLGIGNLRQEAASRLQPYDAAVVTRTIYKIFFQQNKVGDLSVLPAGIRGNLSGQGDITAEISITKVGGFKKAEIEQQIEALPVLSGAVLARVCRRRSFLSLKD